MLFNIIISIETKRDFNLLAGKNSNESHSEESSHSASIGASASLGTNGVGYSIDASNSLGMGGGNTRTTTWQASEVNANNFVLKTGGNANITGSKVKADKVKADIGGDLNITSLQDEHIYEKENHSASMGGSVGMGGASFNASYGKSKIKSEYKSVNEQAGIFAGSGGYDIEVGGRAELVGAVMASEDKSNNKLSTASIGFKDIKNEASFSVDSFSAGASVGTNGFNMSVPSYYHNGSDKLKEKDKTSQTQSAVEAGALVIRDNDKQTQSIDELSRNTKDVHKKLAVIFDEKKELERQNKVERIKDIASQVKDIGVKLFNDSEDKNQKAGTGSTFNKRVDQAASIVTGILTGDVGGAVSGVLAPEVAGLIKKATYEEDEHGNQKTTLKNLLSHAAGGAVLAGIAGNDVLAGATGAAGGELVADLIRKQVYGNKSNSELTEEEKQTISNTAQFLTSFAAGAVSGEDGHAIATSMDAAKNSVENNYLTEKDVEEADKKYATCVDQDCKLQVIRETNKLEQQKEREIFDFVQQLEREMLQDAKESSAICGNDTGCLTVRNNAMLNNITKKYEAYKEIALDGTSQDKLVFEYYPEGIKFAAMLDSFSRGVNKGFDGLQNLKESVVDYIDTHSMGEITRDVWQGIKDAATGIVTGTIDWLVQDLPKQSIEKNLHDAVTMTPEDVGESLVYNSAGYSTAVIGGKIMQWAGGKWISVKSGKSSLDKSAINKIFATENIQSDLIWTSWLKYPKKVINNKQYAEIGGRFYSQHAVDRMQPSGLGFPVGSNGKGRNISPSIVEFTIKNGTKNINIHEGIERTIYWNGDVGVVTENKAKIIVTVLRR